MTWTVKTFFDEATFTASHILISEATRHAAVIDPVWDFDPKAGRLSTKQADAIEAFVKAEGLTIDWILETHVHADHLSAAAILKERLGGRIGIGGRIGAVQSTFREIFNVSEAELPNGAGFDHAFADGERFQVGDLELSVMYTPGHTPACVTYVGPGFAFVGDTLFMPDYGTARCDFPNGDAATLYRSIQSLFALPPETRLYLCHDYKAPGRDDFVWETTVAEEQTRNIHVGAGVSEAAFVEMREKRDATLSAPVLILPAVQVNMRGGHVPTPEANGVSYLKLPVNLL